MFIEFVILAFLLPFMVLSISSYGFEFPSGVTFLFQYSFVFAYLFCAVIVKYIAFLHVRAQQYNCIAT